MLLDRKNHSDVQLYSLKLNSLTIYQGFKMVFSLKSRLHRLEIGSETLQTVPQLFLSISQSPNNAVNEGLKASRINHLQHLIWTFFFEIICDILHGIAQYFAINVL